MSMLEVNAGGVAVGVEPSRWRHFLPFYRTQLNNSLTGNQKRVFEFLRNVERKSAHWYSSTFTKHLWDRTICVSRVRVWVMRFSSCDSDLNDKQHSSQMSNPRNEEFLNRLIHANWACKRWAMQTTIFKKLERLRGCRFSFFFDECTI